jgi:hypothetical protein
MRKIKEQRRGLRIPNKYPVRMIVDKRSAYKGFTKDISQKGAFVITKEPFHVGQTIVLDPRTIQLNYEKRVCSIVRVVQNGVGIQCGKSLRSEVSPLPY